MLRPMFGCKSSLLRVRATPFRNCHSAAPICTRPPASAEAALGAGYAAQKPLIRSYRIPAAPKVVSGAPSEFNLTSMIPESSVAPRSEMSPGKAGGLRITAAGKMGRSLGPRHLYYLKTASTPGVELIQPLVLLIVIADTSAAYVRALLGPFGCICQGLGYCD
jgi:hypothetical protein